VFGDRCESDDARVIWNVAELRHGGSAQLTSPPHLWLTQSNMILHACGRACLRSQLGPMTVVFCFVLVIAGRSASIRLWLLDCRRHHRSCWGKSWHLLLYNSYSSVIQYSVPASVIAWCRPAVWPVVQLMRNGLQRLAAEFIIA